MLYAYLHIFYALMTYLPFSRFSDISRLCSSSVNIFKLVAISKKISNMFTENNLYISGQANSYPCHSRVNYINKPTIFFLVLLLSSIILPVYKKNSRLSLNRAFTCSVVLANVESVSHSVISNSLGPHAPLSMEFSSHEYWSGLLWHSPGDLPNPEVSHIAGRFFTIWATVLANINQDSYKYEIPRWLRDLVNDLPAIQENWVLSQGRDNPPEKEMASTPEFLPGEFHGQRSLSGFSPWSHKESDTTEQLTLTN